jgi:hypothetical protein
MRALRRAVAEAMIDPRATTHAFRHCSAIHLPEGRDDEEEATVRSPLLISPAAVRRRELVGALFAAGTMKKAATAKVAAPDLTRRRGDGKGGHRPAGLTVCYVGGGGYFHNG